MRVLPVIDLSSGTAVHARGGRRESYQTLRSVLSHDANPLGLARAIRQKLGVCELYVADLDSIRFASPENQPIIEELVDDGFELWLDAGLRRAADLTRWNDLAVHTWIVGLETIEGPRELGKMIDCRGAERVVLSLDLDRGVPRPAQASDWSGRDSISIVKESLAVGVCRVLVLDLARVGSGIGTLGSEARSLLPLLGGTIERAIGGGVAGPGDLAELAELGFDAVLVGSAIHDGWIGRTDIALIGQPRIL